MYLGIFKDFMKSLDNGFNQVETFIENHFDNPLLWIMIVVMVLIIATIAYQNLSK